MEETFSPPPVLPNTPPVAPAAVAPVVSPQPPSNPPSASPSPRKKSPAAILILIGLLLIAAGIINYFVFGP